MQGMLFYNQKIIMNKILLLIAVAVGVTFTASAQITKGSSYLGGGINYGSSKTKTDNVGSYEQTVLGVSPSIGFAYKENRVWGLGLNYNYYKLSGSNTKEHNYSAVVFLRQYKPLGKGFYVFAHEQLAGSYFKGQNINGNTSDYNGWGTTAGVSPGFAYDLSRKFQLELVLNNIAYASYNHRTETPVSGTAKSVSNAFEINTGLNQLGRVGNLTIGACYVFGR